MKKFLVIASFCASVLGLEAMLPDKMEDSVNLQGQPFDFSAMFKENELKCVPFSHDSEAQKEDFETLLAALNVADLDEVVIDLKDSSVYRLFCITLAETGSIKGFKYIPQYGTSPIEKAMLRCLSQIDEEGVVKSALIKSLRTQLDKQNERIVALEKRLGVKNEELAQEGASKNKVDVLQVATAAGGAV